MNERMSSLTFVLPPGLREEVEAVAKREQRSLAYALRRLVALGLQAEASKREPIRPDPSAEPFAAELRTDP